MELLSDYAGSRCNVRDAKKGSGMEDVQNFHHSRCTLIFVYIGGRVTQRCKPRYSLDFSAIIDAEFGRLSMLSFVI